MYPFKEIEKKWQKTWLEKSSKKNLEDFKDKYYCLSMFSYPSGDKLHIGHWYNYGPADTMSRYKKLRGYNVFQPQGFDAFGLPAENYAIKNNIHPLESTQKNIKTMRTQLDAIGAMYDWDNIVITCEKEYYKWTQWLFLQLYKNKLAFQKKAPVNWCSSCATVLANEQVKPLKTESGIEYNGCDRCKSEVVLKNLTQWFFRITDYAEELLNFNNLDWPKKTVAMQKHWIGKSQGASISFKVSDSRQLIEVFTTRPDTIFGATYIVLAPDHPLLKSLVNKKYQTSVEKYIKNSLKKNEMQRTELNKDKTGVFTGAYAVNPISNEKIPIWIGDYVLVTYGTGAVMSVPGHDERDYEFAKKYNLKISQVVDGEGADLSVSAYCDSGISINSEFITGLKTEQAKKEILKYIEQENIGKLKINYRLKDWLISRQRYWGTPIPIVYDPDGKAHPVPDEHLPWELPDDAEYKPKGTSPLGTSKKLVDRTEKIFGKGWTPEIDTMDTFVCSSWYFLRYLSPESKNKAFSSSISNNWMPVDLYIGGSEHATMHLLYARFITKALRDIGLLNFGEPFKKLYHQGTITKDGAKMSKSKGNTVSPDKFIDQYGSDVFRCYLMFMGPYDEGGDWNDRGITGIAKFLNKIYSIASKDDGEDSSSHNKVVHKTLKSVTEDLDNFKFNTAISRMMEMSNSLMSSDTLSKVNKAIIIKMISPFAPHLGEELWSILNKPKINSIFDSSWPSFDSNLVVDSNVEVAVQINGKLRGSVTISKALDKNKVLSLARDIENVQKYLSEGTLIKEIYVPGKIINFVIKV